MFDQLFSRPHVRVRYRTGPLLKERLAFLTHLASQGYPRKTLQQFAQDHLAIAKMLGVTSRYRKAVTLDDIKESHGQPPPSLSHCHSMAPVRGPSTTAPHIGEPLREEDQSVC